MTAAAQCSSKDILQDKAKPRHVNFKQDAPPVDFAQRIETEKVWLQKVLRKYTPQLEQHLKLAPTNLPRDPIIKMDQQDFDVANEGLAAMCNGEALSSDIPAPHGPVAPTTPPDARIKKKKFDQNHARFMLASSAWSRSLRSNVVIDLATPSPSRHGSAQGDDPLHLETTPHSESPRPELLPERAATSPRSRPILRPCPRRLATWLRTYRIYLIASKSRI